MNRITNDHNSRNKAFIPFCIILIVNLFVFLPSLVSQYAYRDDFIALIFHSSANFDWLSSVYSKDGRLVLAFLIDYFFNDKNLISDLNHIRFIAVIGNSFFAFTIYHFLRFMEIDWLQSTIISSASSLSLGSVVYIGWAVCFPYTYSATLSTLSGYLMLRYFSSKENTNKGSSLIIFASIAAFLLSAFIYQATLPLFLLPWIIWIINHNELRHSIKVSLVLLISYCGYSIFYLILYKGFLILILDSSEVTNRASFSPSINSLVNQSYGLLERLLSYSFFPIVSSLSVLVSSLAIIGVVYSKSPSLLIRNFFAFSIFLLLGFSPALLSNNQLSDFRTFIAPQVGLIICVFLSSSLYFSLLLRKLPLQASQAQLGLNSLILLTYCISTNHFLNNGMVSPSIEEKVRLENFIERNYSTKPNFLNARLHPWYAPHLSSNLSVGEFGKVSGNNPINAKWFIEFTFAEIFPENNNRINIEFHPFNISNADAKRLDQPVIDFVEILK